MTATYTVDLFATLDGYGSYGPDGDWGGYWGKEGPELLEHRAATYDEPQRVVFGAATFREFLGYAASGLLPPDSWAGRMSLQPTTVISASIAGPVAWPDARIVAEDGVEAITRLKAESPVPLRSHGSLALNRSLLAAGLVDVLTVTVFPVLTGRTGTDPVFAGMGDFDLELLDQRTFDGRTVELSYRPTRHG